MSNVHQWFLLLLILGGITLGEVLYIVPEGRQVFITQFGKIIGEPKVDAGLHIKMPFVQDVRFFDKRILQWDGDPEQIPTKDKKYIWVDTTARWRIKDVRKFAESVQNEKVAATRLDGILDGITRDTISNNNLVETVRNSNKIVPSYDKEDSSSSAAGGNEAGNSIEGVEATPDTRSQEEIVDDITGEIETISTGREVLTTQIFSKAREALREIGIELLDVQLRRVSYEESVERKVYERMITERQKVAAKIRSYGKGEAAKITGSLNLKLKEIESEAYRKAQEIKGKAEAVAIKTYAGALSRDPNFYEFIETLDSYKDTLGGGGTHFLLSSDSPYLKGLLGP